jgi:uncharacterized membrane protein
MSNESTISSTVAIVTFEEHDTAEKAYKSLRRLEKEQLVVVKDAVIVVKNDKGKVKVHETEETSTAGGAAKGGVLGFVVGFMFGGPIGGLLVGGLAGAFMAKKMDFGISVDKIKAVGEGMPNDSSALLVQVESGNAAALRGLVDTHNGTVHDLDISADAEIAINASASAAHNATGGMNALT